MSTRYNHASLKLRRAKHESALGRPELRASGDNFERRAPAGPTSAPIKIQDAETRRLIDKALSRRAKETA